MRAVVVYSERNAWDPNTIGYRRYNITGEQRMDIDVIKEKYAHTTRPTGLRIRLQAENVYGRSRRNQESSYLVKGTWATRCTRVYTCIHATGERSRNTAAVRTNDNYISIIVIIIFGTSLCEYEPIKSKVLNHATYYNNVRPTARRAGVWPDRKSVV